MIVTVTPNPVLDLTFTVPDLVLNEVLRATHTRRDWGGKGFNVSRALLAMGAPSAAMGFVGGATGEQLARGLAEMGIETDLVHIRGETRTNVVITTPSGTPFVKANERGPTVLDEEAQALMRRVRERVQPGDLWALCGSLPPGLPADFYATLTEVLHAAGALVCLDTSGEPLRQAIRARPDLIKPNAEEAAAVLGCPVRGPIEAARAVDRFLALGIQRVALSLGADGLLLASKCNRVWAYPPAIEARNAVGAGDASVAGLLWGLTQALSLTDMARWAVAAGAAAAAGEGVSVADRAQVEAFVEQVTLRPWPGR